MHHQLDERLRDGFDWISDDEPLTWDEKKAVWHLKRQPGCHPGNYFKYVDRSLDTESTWSRRTMDFYRAVKSTDVELIAYSQHFIEGLHTPIPEPGCHWCERDQSS